MGGSTHYRVPAAADRGLAAALALARRIVTRCGRPPVHLRLSWTTARLDAVAALADRFTGARVDAEYAVADSGPLLAALERDGAFVVDATPGRPVLAQFDGRLGAALRLAAVAKPTLEIQVGWDDEPADEALLDTLVSIVDGEELIAGWDCWFEGASGGYNGVALRCNGDAAEVDLLVNYKSPDRDGIARRVATAAGVALDLDNPRFE